MSRRGRILLKSAVWSACLFPLALLLYQFQTDNLGANPIDYVTRTLGVWTLRILLASLAMTPLRLLFGMSWPIPLRRLLGLFAFFYVCLHFAVWIVVDHFFAWEEMLADIVKRPYITVGVLALTLLVPLAATSTAHMVKRLGAKNWRRLHRLVYVVGVLGVLHFLWLAKKGRTDPFVYAAVLGVVLGIRLWAWARRVLSRGGWGLQAWQRIEAVQPLTPAAGQERTSPVLSAARAPLAPRSPHAAARPSRDLSSL